jgi:hypothetical protein
MIDEKVKGYEITAAPKTAAKAGPVIDLMEAAAAEHEESPGEKGRWHGAEGAEESLTRIPLPNLCPPEYRGGTNGGIMAKTDKTPATFSKSFSSRALQEGHS